MMEIFEKASRIQLRFETGRGSLSTEELWQLSLTDLDTMAKAVNKALRDEEEESFIPNRASRKASTNNDLRLEILKSILNTRVDEQDAKKNKAEKLARLSRLKEVAESKSNEALSAQSLEDILKQIQELEAAVV